MDLYRKNKIPDRKAILRKHLLKIDVDIEKYQGKIMNAIMDALWPLGVRSIQMPATPHRVWQAIRSAKGNGKG